jgi:apolipoprotein N-acyltransferase
LSPLLYLILGALYGLAFASPPGWTTWLGFDWGSQAWWLHIVFGSAVLALLLREQHLLFLKAGLFCWAWFSAGLCWLTVSMHVYGSMPLPLAIGALLLFAAYLALYPACALWISARLRALPAQLLISFAMWVGFEWLRGWMFTGFPWLSPGYGQIDAPWAQATSWLGVYGLGAFSWVVAMLIAQCWLWLIRRQENARSLAINGALCFAVALGLSNAPNSFVKPVSQPITVALVQGHIAQDLKFDPGKVQQAQSSYVALTEQAAGTSDLIVLPETAWTMLWENTAPAIRQRIEAIQTPIALGAPALVGEQLTNSVLLLDKAMVKARYDKHHLVPFGEFVPWGFRWFVAMMQIPLGDFSRGPIDQPAWVIGSYRVAFNICYEDLFGEEIAASVRANPLTHVLINVSNLAWFGHSHALPQHLQIARIRAKESGRPMLRSTNTGATAWIDHTGQVQAVLDYQSRGVLRAKVQGQEGITPYVRFGNSLVLLLACIAAIGGWLFARRHSSHSRQHTKTAL